jgi:molybdopterin/thiamine biosynthesis adenylyltransferase
MPGRVVAALLAVLWVGVMAAHLTLPAEHVLLRAIGGSWRGWLVAGAAAVLVLAYRRGLRGLVRRSAPLAKGADAGPFSPAELERYARHIVLLEIGGPGQRRLKDARVLVVGAGGLGSPALLYLAAAGVGTIGVIDGDTVSLSNLQRQIIHADARIGMPKVFSAEAAIRAINPHVSVRPYHRRLTEADATVLFEAFDLVLDGSDNFPTRLLVNRAACATRRPLVSGAIAQWEGQVSLYDPAQGGPCLACIFPEAPAEGLAPSCAEAGVVGALPGVVGAMMAVEAIKALTGAGASLRGRMLIYDALFSENRVIALRPMPGCPVCGGGALDREGAGH